MVQRACPVSCVLGLGGLHGSRVRFKGHAFVRAGLLDQRRRRHAMILQVLAHTWQMLDDWDLMLAELLGGSDAREQEQVRGVQGTRGEENLLLCLEDAAVHGQDARGRRAVEEDLCDGGVDDDGQVGRCIHEVGSSGRSTPLVHGRASHAHTERIAGIGVSADAHAAFFRGFEDIEESLFESVGVGDVEWTVRTMICD